MIEIIKDLWEKEMEVVKAKHLLKENELRQEINTLNDKIKSMEKECNKKVEEATHIKWDKTGEYYNLKDFCRVTRDLLFIKETELKQWLFQQGVLKMRIINIPLIMTYVHL